MKNKYIVSKENLMGKPNGGFLTFMDDITIKPIGVD